MQQRLMIGAVAYGAHVVPIWEGIREHFRGQDVTMDFVLFSNYEAQVEALLAEKIDVAWNTNLAYVRSQLATDHSCRVLAMRDTDVGFQTVLVSRSGDVADVAGLRGKRVALGSADSAQAAILPVHFLAHDEGLLADEDYEVVRFNSDVGKHGDTGRSEVDAMQAVLDGEADAAAMGLGSWEIIQKGPRVPDGALEAIYTTPGYAHCNFTVLPSMDPEVTDIWTAHLLTMDWNDPVDREILEKEGLREWVRPQLDGYEVLFQAVEEQKVPESWEGM